MKSITIRLSVCAFCILFVLGCTTTVSMRELDEIAEQLSRDTLTLSVIGQTFYTGSDSEYDYFAVGTALHFDIVRVRREESRVGKRFPRTDRRTEWREFRTKRSRHTWQGARPLPRC